MVIVAIGENVPLFPRVDIKKYMKTIEAAEEKPVEAAEEAAEETPAPAVEETTEDADAAKGADA